MNYRVSGLVLSVLFLLGCQQASVDESEPAASSSVVSVMPDGGPQDSELQVVQDRVDIIDTAASSGATAAEEASSFAVVDADGGDADSDDVVTVDNSDLLGPGSPAPSVELAAVVHGDPLESLTDGKVHVVEFWATWCGPCLMSMPHISELQDQYGSEVQFIGVTDEDRETVTEFLAEESGEGESWADTLRYTIAIDRDQVTKRNYMAAARQNGIPCAFIVNQSAQVAWIGHPMAIDEPLAQVVNGTFDVEKAEHVFYAEQNLYPALNRGDLETALEILDTLVEVAPDNIQHCLTRLQVLGARGDVEAVNRGAAVLVDAHPEDHMLLNAVAWILATNHAAGGGDMELALTAALQANELTSGTNASILDTVARVYYETGDLASAVDWQRKTVAADSNERGFQKTLEKFEEELKAASKDETGQQQENRNAES